MDIKSFLLGLTAVFCAATSAKAADAIIVEAEPVEYVRICDVYGAGFFYIPGTQTCLKFDGYIRSTYRHVKARRRVIAGGGTRFLEIPNRTVWSYRARINIDARNDTEWGTLRSQLRLEGDGGGSNNANLSLNRALISVAGFRLGYSSTAVTTIHGSGANTAIKDAFYNDDQAMLVDYTFAANNFALTAGVQDSSGTTAGMETPDPYLIGKYSDTWGMIAASYIYDRSANGGAWRVTARLKNIADSGWAVGAWYMSDGNIATQYVTAGFGANGAQVDNQWAVYMSGSLSDDLVGYANYTTAKGDGSGDYQSTSAFAVGLKWAPISSLALQTEYYSGKSDYALAGPDYEEDGFIVRLIRSW